MTQSTSFSWKVKDGGKWREEVTGLFGIIVTETDLTLVEETDLTLVEEECVMSTFHPTVVDHVLTPLSFVTS